MKRPNPIQSNPIQSNPIQSNPIHKERKKAIRLFSFFIGFLFPLSSALAGIHIHRDIATSPVFTHNVYLSAGTHTIETKNLIPLGSAPADTVMYVWEVVAQQQIAYNDDIAPDNYASKVTFHLNAAKWVRVVVFAYSPTRLGIFELHINGNYTTANYFGGHRFNVNSFSSPHDYELVMQTQNISPSTLFLFNCSNQLIAMDVDMSGVGLGSHIGSKVGVCRVLVGTSVFNSKVTVYLNDIQTDLDGDGLGASLEAELGTCNAKTDPFPYCANVIDPRDTDHDGLSDAVEIFGKENTSHPNSPLYLPAWGANPLHKDLFIEVDYMDGYLPYPHNLQPHPFKYVDTENGTVVNPDLQTRLEETQAYFNKQGSHLPLKNPDGLPGISLHFDVGITPPASCISCWKLYGNWGGSNIIPKNSMFLPNPNPQNLTLDKMWDVNPLVSRVALYEAVNLGAQGTAFGLGQFQSSRKDIFFYMVTTPYGNSYYDPNKGHDGRGIKFKFGHGAQTLAHELGHYLGLEHHGQNEWGSFNCKPNYPSIMNYAMPQSVGFSLLSSNFIDSPTVYESIGTGLTCPISPSIPTIDPSYLTNSTFQLALNYPCSFPFFPSIDWNRNGIEDINPIRASLLWNACGNLFQGKQNIILEQERKPTQAAIFRLDDRLYILSSTFSNGQLQQKHGQILKVSSGQGQYGSCQANQDTTLSESCVPWYSTNSVLNLSNQPTYFVRTLSAVWNDMPEWDQTTSTIAYQIGQKIYVTQAKRQNGSHDLKFDQTSTEVVSSTFDADGASTAEIAGITLTWLRVHPSHFGGKNAVLALFYLDPSSRKVRWKTKESPTSSWVDQGDVAFENPNNGTLYSLISAFSPSITQVPHPHVENGITCGLFSTNRETMTQTAMLEAWCFSRSLFSGLRWVRVATSVADSFRKPSLIFHTPRYTNGQEINSQQGYFVATFTNKSLASENERTFVRSSKSFTSGNLPTTSNLFHQYPIRYFYSEGKTYREAILYEDKELAATKGIVTEQASEAGIEATTQIRFLPFADGTYRAESENGATPIFGLRGGNDFEVMELWSCRHLHRTGKWPCSPCQTNNDCPTGQLCLADSRCQ